MSSGISITDYCTNPSKYKTRLSSDEIKMYNSLCNSISQANQRPPIHVIAIDMIVGFVTGMFTDPSQLAFMAITLNEHSVEKLYPKLIKEFSNTLKNFYNNSSILMKTFAEKGYSKQLLNQLFMRRAWKLFTLEQLKNLSVEGVTKAFEFYGVRTLMFLGKLARLVAFAELSVVKFVVSPIMSFVNFIGMVGMAIDLWDPCDLNKGLDASYVQEFTNSMNQSFRDSVLSSITQDTFNLQNKSSNIVVKQWPVDALVDNILLGYLSKEQLGEYQAQVLYYSCIYITARPYNANGQPLYLPPNDTATLINPVHISRASQILTSQFDNNNSVIQNLINRYYPLLYIISFIIIVYIIFIF